MTRGILEKGLERGKKNIEKKGKREKCVDLNYQTITYIYIYI
jgi:hypothetical protein